MEELPWWLPARTCLQCRRPGFSSWVGKIPYWKEWLPTPIFLPGVFHGRRRPAGCSRWGHEESDMTERLTHSHTKTIENSTYVYYFYKIRFSEVSKFYHIISLCVCVCVRAHACMCSVMSDSAAPWMVGRQAPLSMELSRPEYMNVLQFPTLGDLPHPEIKIVSCVCCLGRQIFYH